MATTLVVSPYSRSLLSLSGLEPSFGQSAACQEWLLMLTTSAMGRLVLRVR